MLVALQVILLASTLAVANPECEGSLDRFLRCNNPKVIEYLTGLTQKEVGKTLKGVVLSTGERQLDGAIFLGKAENVLAKGSHVYIFKHMKRVMAYLWVDEGGSELPLPEECFHRNSLESAYVLSWDPYTWKAAQPGHGVVRTMCVKKSWLKAIGWPNQRLKRTRQSVVH